MNNVTQDNLTHLNNILDAIPDIVVDVDINKIYTWANKAGFDFFGPDMIGKEAKYYFEGDQDTYSLVEPIFKGSNELIYLESWQRRKDGQKRLLAWWCHTIKDKNGQVSGAVSTARDITDQKLLEDSVSKSQLILQNIIDLLPVRIFWKDKSLHYLGCNKVFAQDAGKNSPADLIGKDDFEMGWKDQANLYREDDMKVITTGVPKLNYEEPQTTPDGKKIWLNTNKILLKNNHEEAIGVLGTYIDVTDKKSYEENLKKALEETKRMNELMVGRELKMTELKKKIEELENQIKIPASN